MNSRRHLTEGSQKGSLALVGHAAMTAGTIVENDDVPLLPLVKREILPVCLVDGNHVTKWKRLSLHTEVQWRATQHAKIAKETEEGSEYDRAQGYVNVDRAKSACSNKEGFDRVSILRKEKSAPA